MNSILKTKNDLFNIIYNRRSIRRFSNEEVSNEVLEKILKAGFRAPFAAQLCSVVYTRDSEKMKKFKGIGLYPSTKVFMIFFIDFRRMEKIMTQRGHTYDFDDGMTLWLGIQDVNLAIENVILSSEALGLGSVLLGVVPLKADLISEVFNVPDRVFPVVGLCLGYPDLSVETSIRPRFPLVHSAFEDSYKDLSEAEVKECMREMDEGYLTQGYYIKQRAKIPLKEGKDEIDYDKYSWSEHISRKFSQRRWSDDTLFSIIKKHGFNIK
ncbi:MAG: nitroreductase family protein [Candidatus Heimdallarchaeota archaeon]|nr:nitroreductase family protein [Candidatus Heimdallarchaeota archaeon]MCK4769744.1 nitroreductase family protein [Candidatus Heimdallarchaeota archaeon]